MINYIKKVGWLFVNLFELNKKKPVNNRKAIVLDLNNNYYDRYLWILCLFFQYQDYQILIKPNFGFLNNWRTNFLIKGTKNIAIYSKSRKYAELALYIYDRKKNLFHVQSKILNFDYFNQSENEYRIPIPLVDTFYKSNFLWEERKEIKNKRNIKLFFAGNFDKHHNDHLLTQKFQVPTRKQTLEFLMQELNISTAKIGLNDINFKTPEILIFDRKKKNVPPQDLVKFLNNSKFFLALPGVVMPLCHNIIEAMALGCIPILNYNHLFSPKLTNEVNCLTYSSLDDLKKVIINLENIDEASEQRMRKNVLKYYEKYLSIESVVDEILNTNMSNISLCAEHQSVELIKD